MRNNFCKRDRRYLEVNPPAACLNGAFSLHAEYFYSEWEERWRDTYYILHDARCELVMPLHPDEVSCLKVPANSLFGFSARRYEAEVNIPNLGHSLFLRSPATLGYWGLGKWLVHLQELPRPTFVGRERLFRCLSPRGDGMDYLNPNLCQSSR